MLIKICGRIPKITILSLTQLVRTNDVFEPGRIITLEKRERTDCLSIPELIGVDRRTISISSMVGIRTLKRGSRAFHRIPDGSLPVESQLRIILWRPGIVELSQLRQQIGGKRQIAGHLGALQYGRRRPERIFVR